MISRKEFLNRIALGMPLAVAGAASLSTTAWVQTTPNVGAISVFDFGAVGDGSQNDSGAIQAALDTGRNVYFPPGNYRTDDQVIVRSARQLIFGPVAL